MSLEIRQLTPNDLDAYRRVRLSALEHEPTAFGASHETEAGARGITIPRTPFPVAPTTSCTAPGRESTLLGMAGFVRETGPKRRHIGNIWGVYVEPSARGTGIGRELLSAVVQRTRRLVDLRHVRLGVTADNTAAIALYESLGFVAWGREPAALRVDDVDYDEVHMTLELADN